MSIKLLPPQYVIKRWTREAHSGTIQDKQRINIIENPIMDALLRCRYMSNKFFNLAYQAANFPQCTMLVDNTLDILCKQIEEMIITFPSTSMSPSALPTNASSPYDMLM
jgi:zinc finger SWIM domain-containing protein 3